MRFLRRAKQPVKFTFTISIKEIMVEGSNRWQPRSLSVKLRRRKRHYSIEPKSWEPTLRNPYRGITFWSQAANVQLDVTLYKNSIDAFEEKLWKLDVLDHEYSGKIKRIATLKLDLSLHTTSNVTLDRLPLKTLESAIDSTISLSINVEPVSKSSDTQILSHEADYTPQECEATHKQSEVLLHDNNNCLQKSEVHNKNTNIIDTSDLQQDENSRLRLDNKHSQESVLENNRTAEDVGPDLNTDDKKLESHKTENSEETAEESPPPDRLSQEVATKLPTTIVVDTIVDNSEPKEETSEEARARQLREKARKLIATARRGELAKPSRGSISAHSTPKKVKNGFSSISSFETARQNSIEIYDYPTSNDEDEDDRLDIAFRRNSVATRSARMRRFRFYQFRRVHDDTQATENFFKTPDISQSLSNNDTLTNNNNSNHNERQLLGDKNNQDGSIGTFRYSNRNGSTMDNFESCDSEQSILIPREDVIQGKIPIGRKESSCVGDELKSLEEEQRQIEEKTVLLKNQFMELTQKNGSLQVNEQAKNGTLLPNFSLSSKPGDMSINLESNDIAVSNSCSLESDTEEQQKKLLKELCELVNKKNDVIRRQMQLNILEKEATLERTFEQLDKELRSIMLVEESKKTENQKQREKYLLDELVALVEKRNELVHDLDAQEKAIEEDNNLRENLRHVKLGDVADDQNCCIQ